MTEQEKQEVATFRFSIIHELVDKAHLKFGDQEKLIKDKCAREWDIPNSDRTSIGRSTILGWVSKYRESGNNLKSLFPKDRDDRGKSRAYDKDTCLGLIHLRKEKPGLSVPVFSKIAKERRILPPDTSEDLSTLYRFLNSHGLMDREPSPSADRRKFEAELPNDLWQSDVMHGPKLDVGGERARKTYLIAFIDDHSRLITHGQFYISEALASFKIAFEEALLTRGLPRKLYVDNGAAYKSKQLQFTSASLGIALIHAKPYTPQGKGKIERFFRTVRTEFLTCFLGDTLDEINEAFDLWLREIYHKRRHSGTGQAPFRRFTANMQCVRSAPKDLKDHFRKILRRRVNKDRTIMVQNRLFEAPVELVGQRVEVLFHENSPEEIEVRWKQESYGIIRQLDLHINSRVKRDKNCQTQLVGEGSHPESGQLWEEK
jgi:putative transposase